MKYGIVGSEEAKFTPETELLAREQIADLLNLGDTVISGECHLGGIDIWAKEYALENGIAYVGFPPKTLYWSDGYKPRNIQIAEAADIVICITVKELPLGYEGMRFGLCYHCRTKDHVKSGGCWTVKYAKEKLNKSGLVIVI